MGWHHNKSAEKLTGCLRCAAPPLARFGDAQHRSASLLRPDGNAFGLLFSFRNALRVQVDTELLTFLIKMAALQTKRFRRVRNVVLIAAEFGEDSLAFEL